MAYIYTNYLTGNDTTGDGTTGSPYKTLMKGLAGATSGDEIRSAGGQWTPITGTMTFTNGLNTVSTTTDLRSVIAAQDTLTFEDGQFGFDKFHVRVNTITATTITLFCLWTGPTITTSAVSKIDLYHYSFATSNTGIESFNNANLQPNGRTDVKISGGWNSDYSSNANGWTVYRQTTSTGALFTSGSAPGMGNWKNELVIDKFMLATSITSNQSFLWSLSGGTGSSWAFGEIAQCGQFPTFYSSNVSTSYSGGIWSPKTSNSKWYLTAYNAAPITSQYMNSTYYTPITALPAACNMEIWASTSQTNISSSTTTPIPYCYSLYTEASLYICKNVKIRTLAQNNTAGAAATLSSIGQNGVTTAENIELYCNRPMVYTLNIPASSSMQLGGISLTGPSGPFSGLVLSSAGGIGLTNLTTVIETATPTYAATSGATSGTVDIQTTLSRISQVNLAPIQIQDSEGYKTIDILNNVYYKDQVNNWLRVTGSKFSSSTGQTGGFTSWKLLGVLNKPTTPFTVSLTLKTEIGTWDQIGIQWGGQASQIITQGITPTSSFATYTISVDPSAYPEWESFVNPLYLGIRSNMPNAFYQEPCPVAYIQSLTIV
jgi:hypothetical protein